MRAYERLLRYAAVDTQSDDTAATVPSTARQFHLAKLLEQEMLQMGLEDVASDEHAYTYGYLPATPGREDAPVIGLIAHIDTAPDFSGTGVKPTLHPNYDGGELPLGESGRVLSPAHFPELKSLAGHTLITSDGTTLLGADDKAGIAEILTACERLMAEGRPHGGVALCFPPDEEIGHGAELLDLERFGAEYAYTVDGDTVNEINFETFNAASAEFVIRGVSVHPGSAWGIMVNASLIAMEINAMLPETEIPAMTREREGYFHLGEMHGGVEQARLHYIIRDHDAARFAGRMEQMRRIERELNAKYGEGTVTLTLAEQYRNMAEVLSGRMEIVERAENAIRRVGLKPVRRAVRGGTDGASLSFRGLPCPNLGTGGAAYHGPYEHISVENMDTAVEILLHILEQ